MLKSVRASWLSLFLLLLGCGSTDGGHSLGQAGAAGQHAASGSGPSGGASVSGMGGFATGGASGAAGVVVSGFAGSASGGSSASAGTASVGFAGSGSGQAANGGAGGGSAGAGASAGTTGRGPAPTFTKIYETIITPNCGGAICHLKRPTPFGYDFSSKSAASASWRADVVAHDAENSPMFQVLNLAIMPKDKPPLSVAQLFMVYDWINAGALDN